MVATNKLTSPDEILQIALKKEQEAHEFYAAHAATCRIDFVRDLLEKLANEESKHLQMVRHMIARLEAGRDIV